MPTYDPLKRLILKLNKQIEDLTTAKRVLESMNGSAHRVQHVANMEMAISAHRDYKAERERAAAKAAAGRPKKTYKAGAHWTQTPAGRKKMAMHMKRRMKAAKAAGSSVVLPDPK